MACVISCTICSEFYKSTDDVYSTSCGHIYHFHCMKQWQSRFTSCPQCRTFQPSTHKIFLNFDDNADAEKQILELKEEANVNKLMRSWNEEQLLKNEKELKLLKDQIAYLNIVNETRAREIKVKESHIDALRELRAIGREGGKPAALFAKLNELEDRFELVFLELTKEITKTMQATLGQPFNFLVEEATKKVDMMLEALKNHPMPETPPKATTAPKAATTVTPPTQPSVLQTPPNPNAVGIVSHAVVIKGVPRQELDNLSGPTQVVWMLGQLMDLLVEDEDIEKAFILKGRYYNNFSKRVALVVEFKTMNMKLRFMKNSDRLQDYVEWDVVTVSQYMSAGTSALFHHAQSLKNIGYTKIYHENDRVYAKLHLFANPQRITSKEQVDEMIAEVDDSSD